MARSEEMNGARHVVGIGARRGVDARDIVDLVKHVAGQNGVALDDLTLCTHESKTDEAGLHEAAGVLGVELVFLPAEALRQRSGAAPTHSPRVKALFGVGSVAESAALVGAGPGSRLIARRVTTPVAACAIARRAEEPE